MILFVPGPLLTREAVVKGLKVPAIEGIDGLEEGITIKARGQACGTGLGLKSASHLLACADVAFRNEGVALDSSQVFYLNVRTPIKFRKCFGRELPPIIRMKNIGYGRDHEGMG